MFSVLGRGFGRGFGHGFGYGRGMGFGFRGYSPPWPYVGRGRGGLPRCSYFLSGAAREWPYHFYAGTPPASGMASERESDYLKSQAAAIKEELKQIEARMSDLETKTHS